jgi:DNA-binding Lrp family transcriptional regulator
VVGDVYLEVEPGLVREIADKLAGFEMISYLACSTGDKEISLQIYARDHKEIYTLVTYEISKIPGVRKTHISFVPFVVKDDINWPIPTSCVTQADPE